MLHLIYNISRSFGRHWRFRRAVSLAVLITFSSSMISPAFAQAFYPIVDIDNEVLEDVLDDGQGKGGDAAVIVGVYHVLEGFTPGSDIPPENKNIQSPFECLDDTCEAIKDEGDRQNEDVSPVVLSHNTGTDSVDEPGYMAFICHNSEYGEFVCDQISKIKDGASYVTGSACQLAGERMCEHMSFMLPFLGNEGVKKVFGRQLRNSIFKDGLKSVFTPGETIKFLERNTIDSIRPGMYKKTIASCKKGNFTEAGEVIKRGVVGSAMLWPIQIFIGHVGGPALEGLGLDGRVANDVAVYSKANSKAAFFHEFSGKTSEMLVSLEYPKAKWVPTLINAVILYGLNKVANHLNPGAMANHQILARLAASEAIASVVTTGAVVVWIVLDSSYDKYSLFDFTEVVNDLNKNMNLFYEHGRGGLNKIIDDPSQLPSVMQNGFKEVINMLNNTELGQMASVSQSEFYPQLAETLGGGLSLIVAYMIGGTGALVDRARFEMVDLYIKSDVASNALATKERLIRSKSGAVEEKWEIIKDGLYFNGAIDLLYVGMIVFPNLISSTPAGRCMVQIWSVQGIVKSFDRNAKADLGAFNQKEQGWSKTAGDWIPFVIPFIEWAGMKGGLFPRNNRVNSVFTAISFVTTGVTLYALYYVVP